MKTEEEARKCWCPFARGIQENGGNRMAYGGEGEAADPQYGAEMTTLFPCIASECMAWRWIDPGNPKIGRPAHDMLGAHGYCGLAGHPLPLFSIDAGGPKL